MSSHIELTAGEKLQAGDEYSTGNGWKEVPSFMVGDKIPSSATTQWRREVSDKNVQPTKKTSFFAALFRK